MTIFHSLLHMIDTLLTGEDCRVYLENMRWGGKQICPHCGSISEHHYKLIKDGNFEGLYKCKDSHWRFTVRQGTMFEVELFMFIKYLRGHHC